MLVLSLDTTRRAGSCALSRDGRVLRVQAGDPAEEQGGQLPGALAALLDHESVSLSEIDGYGVAVGPGSFTRLRVGIATMQGLAMATGKPLIGVSTLDALAMLAGARKGPVDFLHPGETAPQAASHVPGKARVVAWIEAWRGDVFSATYDGGHALEEPVVAHPDDLLKHMRGHTALFVGDGAARNLGLIRAALGDNAHLADPIAPLLAGAVAAAASEALDSGQHPPPHAIRPIYVQRLDSRLTINAEPA